MVGHRFISTRIIDGKPRKAITDETGKIIVRNPTKEEYEYLKEEPYKTKKHKKYTSEELLEFLIEFERREGRSPKEHDFIDNPKYPLYGAYIRTFGSWNNALKMAGLTVNYITNAADEELLDYLTQFFDNEGRPPTEDDFKCNLKYPSHVVYCRRFGSWQNALKFVELDNGSMAKRGIVETKHQKARLAEMLVLGHFAGGAQDLSGENYTNHPYDGICPKSQTYDVKSSKLYKDKYYNFDFRNANRDEIEWYFLLGFNKDYTKLEHTWRIPALDFVDEERILIWVDGDHPYNLENMEEYEITEKIKYIFKGDCRYE